MIVLLILCLTLPIAAALLLMLFHDSVAPQTARWIALGGSLLTLLVSLALVDQYRKLPTHPVAHASSSASASVAPIEPKFEVRVPWFTLNATNETSPPIKFELHLGLDGVSVVMIVLTALLSLSAVLISWHSIEDRTAVFFSSLMFLEAALIGVFCAFDMILFYVFFEFTLIPFFILIAVWGGDQRRFAATQYFLYTLVGSLVLLLGLVGLAWQAASSGLTTPSSLPDLAAWLAQHPLAGSVQTILFLLVAIGLFVKVPLVPLHTWLPLMHGAAPTVASVMLLKIGVYAFLRLCLPMFPNACMEIGVPLVGGLAVIGIIYGSLGALKQRDMKRLIAYSSVAHVGFCMLGLFALNEEGIAGGVLQMLNLGLSTGALFLLVGMIQERYGTRDMDQLSGLASRLPLLACFMVFIVMASIGLPGLNGFVGEMLSLAGMFKRNIWFSALGATGIVLGAWYLLTLLQHSFFGPLKEPTGGGESYGDLSSRELAAIVPLAVLCLWIGLYPAHVLDLIRPEAAAVAQLYENLIP